MLTGFFCGPWPGAASTTPLTIAARLTGRRPKSPPRTRRIPLASMLPDPRRPLTLPAIVTRVRMRVHGHAYVLGGAHRIRASPEVPRQICPARQRSGNGGSQGRPFAHWPTSTCNGSRLDGWGPTSRHHSHCGRPHTSRCVPRLVQLPGPVGTRDARQNQQLGSLLSALAPGFDNPLTRPASCYRRMSSSARS